MHYYIICTPTVGLFPSLTGHGELLFIVLLFRAYQMEGMPIAWMISSNAHQETITFLLHAVQIGSPEIKPKRIMSDKDRAQMNSIQVVYPESQLLLCWWHVLHAWQQHFVT